MYVVSTGTPFDGIDLTGPFESGEEAIEYASTLDEPWGVIELTCPPINGGEVEIDWKNVTRTTCDFCDDDECLK